MDLQYSFIHGSPIAWSDDLFSEQELGKIYKECDTIRKQGLLKEDTHGARRDGNLLKKNKGLFFEEHFGGNSQPPETVITIAKKIYNEEFVCNMEKLHPYFRLLRQSDGSTNLLSYYDTSDYYKPHMDDSSITVLLWLYKEPKTYTGGDFIIEHDFELECKRGRILFMPGWLYHEVTPVKMWADYQGQGLGRYSISHFVNARRIR